MEMAPMSISFVVTLLIFSYLLGDNVLYRLTIAVFVGLTAAFTTIVTFESVILPLLPDFALFLQDPSNSNGLIFALALTFALALLLKPLARFNLTGSIIITSLLAFINGLTNIALAFLIAVGAAVAVVGALTGTLIPLVMNTAQGVDGNIVDTVVILLAVVTTLIYFQYLARQETPTQVTRGFLVETLSGIGEVFIAITLGALYGTAILSSLTILTGHLSSLLAG